MVNKKGLYVSGKLGLLVVVWFCATGWVLPGPVRADINFGHTESAKEIIDKVDENVRDQQGLGANDGSSCMVDYPDWLSGVNSVADMRERLLVPDTGPSSPLPVKNNADFDEAADLTSDTIIQRCNTYFRDQNDNDVQHWIYCRAFQLPSGDTYTDLETLRTASDSDPPGLYTVAWFHGSNIDDPSENWMIPLVNQYKSGCRSRPLNVIWMGVRVTDQSQSPPEDLESLGNKWHVTSTSWDGTVLDQVMGESELNFSAHTTASCPLDATPTHGLWPGGDRRDRGATDYRELYG